MTFKEFPHDRAKKLIEDYAAIYADAGYLPERHRNPYNMLEEKCHVYWMITQLSDMLDKQDKFYRWLGFIQGCMWWSRMRSIDEMRVDNYVLLNGKLPEE